MKTRRKRMTPNQRFGRGSTCRFSVSLSGACHAHRRARYGRMMTGRYDPRDLTTDGAMDDEKLDMILDALDRVNEDRPAL